MPEVAGPVSPYYDELDAARGVVAALLARIEAPIGRAVGALAAPGTGGAHG